MNVQRGDKSIGHHYAKVYDCTSYGACNAVMKALRSCSTILMMLLLGILVILAITGHSVTITIGNDAGSSNGLPLPAKSSIFFPDAIGAFVSGDDPISYSLLLDHARNSTITVEEDAILQAVFAQYDGDDDGLWSYVDFANFMEDTLHFDETFAFLDSKTNDGVIEYDELVMILTAFDSVPLLHTDEVNQFLVDVTGLPLEEAQEEEPEVLATLICEEVGGERDGISRDEWFEYAIAGQWAQFNDDMDSFIDLTEFERDFFESEMFLVFQECNREEECANPHAAIKAFNESERVHHTRRRLEFLPVPQRSGRRRLAALILAAWIIGGLVALGAMSIPGGQAIAHNAEEGKYECYDDLSSVIVMKGGGEQEVMPMKDVSVGDFVYDGSEFSKVYFVQQHPHQLVNMLEIKYGIPSDGQSITVSPAHLLYREAAPLPVRSDEVMIGDVLWGSTEYSYGDGFNFTVYDISTVQRIPVNPITMSSDMMVNGIKTSVYSHSVENRNALHEAAAIFRWTSINIDETLSQNVMDFYYNTVYKGMMPENMKTLTMSNGAVLGAVYLGVPLVLGAAVFKAANLFIADRTIKKTT